MLCESRGIADADMYYMVRAGAYFEEYTTIPRSVVKMLPLLQVWCSELRMAARVIDTIPVPAPDSIGILSRSRDFKRKRQSLPSSMMLHVFLVNNMSRVFTSTGDASDDNLCIERFMIHELIPIPLSQTF
jgi:hypothetical protein